MKKKPVVQASCVVIVPPTAVLYDWEALGWMDDWKGADGESAPNEPIPQPKSNPV